MENLKEIWKDIEGFEGLFQVSNLGNVKSLDRYVPNKYGTETFKRGQAMKMQLKKSGYLQIGLRKEGKKIFKRPHRLVCEAFIPNPDNLPVVNHINENKTDNRVENLEWANVRQNTNYSSNSKAVSKYPGVTWHTRDKKWTSKITVNKKRVWLGAFDDELLAAKAYTDYCKKHNIAYKINR